MFENPHLIYFLAKEKHKELLTELEIIQKIKSSSVVVKKKNKRFGSIMLPIAELLIAIGVSLKKRFGSIPERAEDIAIDLPE